MVGGILLALGGNIPISPYVTTISFTLWLVSRLVRAVRERSSSHRRMTTPRGPVGAGAPVSTATPVAADTAGALGQGSPGAGAGAGTGPAQNRI